MYHNVVTMYHTHDILPYKQITSRLESAHAASKAQHGWTSVQANSSLHGLHACTKQAIPAERHA